MLASVDPSGFDEAVSQHAGAYTLDLTNQELLTGDWAKGPAGSGEADWAAQTILKISLDTGCLAQSWEIPQPGTMIFHIRQGVHFALDPENEASRLVNGREINATDIAATLNRYISTPKSPLSLGDTRFATITAPDEWTVECELPLDSFSDMIILANYASSGMAPELVKKYGDLTDWKNNVGTGPFILTDYVAGSSATLVRNKNYWAKDPVGPGKGNQLPYADGARFVIVPDVSTQLAAMRTAKIDVLNNVYWENAKSLQQTTPNIKQKAFYTDSSMAISMRVDKQNLPYKDIRVRQALMMATDFDTIQSTWAGGTAQIETWPILNCKEYADAYLSLDQAPASVQELYTYNPDKAKQLLAEAGYPDGFKCTIVCPSNPTSDIDYLSIIKDMWSKVGVDMTINPVDIGVYMGLFWGRQNQDMILGGPGPIGDFYLGFPYVAGPAGSDQSFVDDPKADAVRTSTMSVALTDPAKADELFKAFMPYVLAQAWAIPAVIPPQYQTWWPWVKNYDGEYSMGFSNAYNYAEYVWIDQGLKQQMTGQK